MSGGKKERQKNMTFSKSVFVFAFVVAALLTVTIGLGGACPCGNAHRGHCGWNRGCEFRIFLG